MVEGLLLSRARTVDGIIREHGSRNDLDAFDVALAAQEAVSRVPQLPRGEVPYLCYLMLRHCVRYRPEYTDQFVRYPWRLLRDGIGDCKSFGVFAASLCARAGCATVLRFVIWRGDDHFGHVYAVADGVAIDPTPDDAGRPLAFGIERPYTCCLDIQITDG